MGHSQTVTSNQNENDTVNTPMENPRDETVGLIRHAGKSNVWKCPKCGKEYNSNSALVKHLKSNHNLTLSYQCPRCGRVDENCRSIGCHMKYCQGNEQEKLFKCERCDFSSDYENGVLVHVARMHKAEYNETLPEKKVFRWNENELRKLAEEELKIREDTGMLYINIPLQKIFPHRTIQAIGKIRQGKEYKMVMSKLEAEKRSTELQLLERQLNLEDEIPIQLQITSDVEENEVNNAEEEMIVEDESENESGKSEAAKFVENWCEKSEGTDEVDRHLIEYCRKRTTWEECKELLFTDRTVKKNKPQRVPKGPLEVNRKENRNTRKYRKFKFLQQQYGRDRRGTLRDVIDGKFQYDRKEEVFPKIEEVEKVYVERLESRTMKDETPTEKIPPIYDNVVYGKITMEEVKEVISDTKRDTANGFDYIKLTMIKQLSCEQLSVIFNLWWAESVPVIEKSCRTILLPKSGDRTNVGNWRPITIGNLLIRLYAKIWDKRLRKKITINERQKAFVPMDGCFENVKILQTVMKQSKKQKRELNIVFLDLAKAFDTVLHTSISKALERKGVPKEVCDMVLDLYEGALTEIRTPVGKTRKIDINAGVKQGCPLSPLLFNLVMDELVERELLRGDMVRRCTLNQLE